MIGLVVIGSLSSDMRIAINEMSKLFTKHELVVKTVAEMQKTILIDSEILIQKVLSGRVQID